MKVLVTGASGYIGRQLAEKLSAVGRDVTCMVRNTARAPPKSSALTLSSCVSLMFGRSANRKPEPGRWKILSEPL